MIEEFFNAIPNNFNENDKTLIAKAFKFAQKAHAGQKRKSGRDYFEHPKQAAIILGQIFPDAATLAATLMHDIPEDTPLSLEDVKKEFGEVITRLIDGVTQLGHVRMKDGKDKYYVENLRKLFVATSQDIRVILIKLADRIHNMRTIDYIPKDKQLKVATETLEIYAAIAARLGINNWKDELQDLCFRIVHPQEFIQTHKILKSILEKREQNIKKMQKNLAHIFRTEGIKYVEITGRIKRLYSLYQKLQKYEGDIDNIYDIIALRVVTKTTADCYSALGIIHKHFQPVPNRLKDFIANPKPNGYQSIHTTVFDKNKESFEIQIRTDLMHEEAERGIAAHWFYAEEGKPEKGVQAQTTWIKELRSWQEETMSPEEYLENLKIELFRHRIFVYTPKGDIKDLPLGATVIDFAFAVHTDLGYHMMGAKVNEKMASIYDELGTEDIVEIIKSKLPAKISADWLKAAKTPSARNKIRSYLNKNKRSLIQRVKGLIR